MNKTNSGAAAYQQQEQGYRDKALKMYPWVCGRCAREFVHSNLRELTVHHIDHNHSNNPADGSNWELLCIYCHDNEHNKFHEFVLYGGTTEQKVAPATHNPFADLKALLNKPKS
ncbi:MAG: YajD family HNH nuclease [Gammaproteobacteria bacterium]|nr:YajD family HNH nuclease [Gammaproteobacteria bacterium]MBU1556634.1 YajD family HNH nuclease [Gammaproteobacteria bacterium]MBU2069789.1 YajD family HNH nuclease [Gammaproteobacteria bacterium]MBU2184654.1 YajD family HNH nuclease [Gammaproteobacteria bacterium]MBU2205680.1 YajD family HNH nuclease [Gammaproteobacteria bacterium]